MSNRLAGGGSCPRCGGPLGEAAGRPGWILCSLCHTTYSDSEFAADADLEVKEATER